MIAPEAAVSFLPSEKKHSSKISMKSLTFIAVILIEGLIILSLFYHFEHKHQTLSNKFDEFQARSFFSSTKDYDQDNCSCLFEISQLNSSIQFLNTSIADTGMSILSLSTANQALWGSFMVQKQDFIALNASLLNSVNSLQGTVNTLSSTVSSIQSSVATLQNNVNSLQGSYNSLSNSENNLEGTVGGLSSSLAKVNTTVSSLQGSYSSLSNTVTSIQSSVNSLQGSYTTLSNSENNLEGTVNSLSSSLSKVNSTVTSLQGSYSTLASQESILQGNVSSISGSVSSLQGNYYSLSSSISTLQNTVDNLIPDSVGNVYSAWFEASSGDFPLSVGMNIEPIDGYAFCEFDLGDSSHGCDCGFAIVGENTGKFIHPTALSSTDYQYYNFMYAVTLNRFVSQIQVVSDNQCTWSGCEVLQISLVCTLFS